MQFQSVSEKKDLDAIAAKNYTQLSLSERYQISALKETRQSIKYIADQLNRSPKISDCANSRILSLIIFINVTMMQN